ncbi:hypothetical protein APA22_05340 [Acetobacter pasteurianus IFO 3283-22]|uniref:Uncharacterized protein n=2 Tax=Acetobacter pasteurianus TaxID=438 RepID=C7JDP0_ACEP3|nr:hypothetical protein S101468_00670 [Acetobacter pasteurianus subsp. pasteurianus]BAH98684.1 hypothetical protein APA01_05340 [Acetobacter pasteurianus IFO 3283-01]BAI01735.1 hypothetical protein APA03_05340 [Acetobacter pasteurianus IFO 3283-03]BAI04783.1 hypothetical protein APA07_05340 [Acetobacter pasteurianus IFO 3283-07]BAI07830.1 hypothetical protein APA22_05340 [Acetobacter pasteurianus IFO 3283-22]BAI10878.1 hypothetical protein APA26_05340 [Acetobacter pasteurianus IFO 3283-26]BAI
MYNPSVRFPRLQGGVLPVFAARTGSVRHKVDVGSVRGMPDRQKGVLQNNPSVSRRVMLEAGTSSVAAEDALQDTQHRKARQHKPKDTVELLARRPFSMPPARASRGRRFVPRILAAEKKGASVVTPISARPALVRRQGVLRDTKTLESTGSLENILVHGRGFQSVSKQPVRGGLRTSQRVAMPDKAQPVARNMVGAFLPSSPLMRAAVQPVVPVARPAPAAYVPQTSARAFATPAPHPAPMPSRVAMQGLGGGDSATLAALSTLGSI